MRRMYSEGQLEQVVKKYLENNVITFGDSIYFLNTDEVYFTDSERSLNEYLDDKQDLFPTDLSEVEETFSDTPTGFQLPNANVSDLTAEQVEDLRENMLYWIKKGYVKADGSIIKINGYKISDSYVTISASYEDIELDENDSPSIESFLSISVFLDTTAGKYYFSFYEV